MQPALAERRPSESPREHTPEHSRGQWPREHVPSPRPPLQLGNTHHRRRSVMSVHGAATMRVRWTDYPSAESAAMTETRPNYDHLTFIYDSERSCEQIFSDLQKLFWARSCACPATLCMQSSARKHILFTSLSRGSSRYCCHDHLAVRWSASSSAPLAACSSVTVKRPECSSGHLVSFRLRSCTQKGDTTMLGTM